LIRIGALPVQWLGRRTIVGRKSEIDKRFLRANDITPIDNANHDDGDKRTLAKTKAAARR
jgi:hypothetical protein